MVREAKYRGFSKENNRWYVGHGHFLVEHTEDSGLEDYSILHTEDGVSYVDPKSIGEFTGFKDAQGTEIFEGDILREPNRQKGFHVVIWKDGGFQRKYRFIQKYQGEEYEETTYMPIHPRSFIVVGNIYEQEDPLN